MNDENVNWPSNYIGRRLHPAMSRRIVTSSTNPNSQLHACWQMLADQTEQLETIMRNVATMRHDPDATANTTMGGSKNTELIVLLAAKGLHQAKMLMAEYVPDDAESADLPNHVMRILSNVMIVLSAVRDDSSVCQKSLQISVA